MSCFVLFLRDGFSSSGSLCFYLGFRVILAVKNVLGSLLQMALTLLVALSGLAVLTLILSIRELRVSSHFQPSSVSVINIFLALLLF